jgi:hypothetical protein
LDHYLIDQTIALDDYAVERAAMTSEFRVDFDASRTVFRGSLSVAFRLECKILPLVVVA